jgi:hypothetical protein
MSTTRWTVWRKFKGEEQKVWECGDETTARQYADAHRDGVSEFEVKPEESNYRVRPLPWPPEITFETRIKSNDD